MFPPAFQKRDLSATLQLAGEHYVILCEILNLKHLCSAILQLEGEHYVSLCESLKLKQLGTHHDCG